MARDDEFRPRLGRSRVRQPSAPFLNAMRSALAKEGSAVSGGRYRGVRHPAASRRLRRGGGVAIRFAARGRDIGERRVIVKARIVRQGTTKHRMLAHLFYVKRDGVTRDGAPSRLFDAVSDDSDEKRFAEQCRDDRHHFRFIISPEDGALLTDLRAFTRDLMAQMAADLETRLAWVAIDHHNTDNPHIHVTVRGVDEAGGDLVIDRDYLTDGLRRRAQGIATLELGRETKQDIAAKQRRDIQQGRFTELDRTLARLAGGGQIDLTGGVPVWAPPQAVLRARLSVLHRMELAEETAPGQWRLAPDFASSLRALQERADIVKTVERTLSAHGLERPVAIDSSHCDGGSCRLIGRVLSKADQDDIDDRLHLVVDGADGHAHYLPVRDARHIAAIRPGMLVEIRYAAPPERTTDPAILHSAREPDGPSARSLHRGAARHTGRAAEEEDGGPGAPQARQRGAPRRSDRVAPLDPACWRVREGQVAARVAFDRGRTATITALSLFDLDTQVTARGPTWLDRQLLGGEAEVFAGLGFAAELRGALDRRTAHLVARGLAQRRADRILFARDLLATLEEQELDETAQSIADARGLTYRRAADGERVRGVFVKVVDLAAGRYAVIENGGAFMLVPWQPALDGALGHEVGGIMRSRDVLWSRGLGRDIAV